MIPHYQFSGASFSEIAGLRSTAESTKEDTTKLLNKADEQMEAAGMHHEDTMLGQDEIKDLVEEGQGEILDAFSLQHEESSQQLSSILQVVTMLKESQEGAKKNGNVAEVMKLERKIVELQKTIDNLRQSIIKERKENKELKHELKLAKTPQKPRRGLAPLPTNFSAKPATKRMVAAEMKHVGLKTDVALVDAEGVKRGNSSTLLP